MSGQPEEREYTVAWTMQVSAPPGDFETAARLAAGYQRYPGSSAVVFDVSCLDTLGDADGTEVTTAVEVDLWNESMQDGANDPAGTRVRVNDLSRPGLGDCGTVVFGSPSACGEDRWTIHLDDGGLVVRIASQATVLAPADPGP